MIGVTVTHDETNAPSGDDAGLDPVEGSLASAEPITPPADLAEVVEEAEVAADLESDTAAEDEFGEDEDEDEAFVVSPYDQPGRWYVVHTYAGYENKVKSNLHSRAVS